MTKAEAVFQAMLDRHLCLPCIRGQHTDCVTMLALRRLYADTGPLHIVVNEPRCRCKFCWDQAINETLTDGKP